MLRPSLLRRLTTFTISCLLFPGALWIAACSENSSETTAHNHQAPPQETSPAATPLAKRIPAYFKVPPNPKSLPETLSPDLFNGDAREAYQIAREIPVVLAQLPCFCYCDYSAGHKSLHSCFEDQHSAGCPLCQDSARMAKQLKDDGLSIDQIREKLIAKYGKIN
ncbi:MAG: hypothetical protein J2P41_06980 [Blastocatellia bacterium]|nr:hypothetical protein [Blastocatellia bacterium]